MKKTIALFSACLMLVVSAVICFAACGNADSRPKWDSLSIRNLASYKGLGAAFTTPSDTLAGTVTAPSDTVKFAGENVVLTSAGESRNSKLVGQKADGTLEIVQFTDDDGQTTEQSLKLIAYRNFGVFTLLGYANPGCSCESMQHINSWASVIYDGYDYQKDLFSWSPDFPSGHNDFYYVLDNKSGVIFDLYDAIESVVSEKDKGKIPWNISFDSTFADGAYIDLTTYYTYYLGNRIAIADQYIGCYKITFANKKLVLQKMMNGAKYSDFADSLHDQDTIYSNSRSAYSDKYGNLYSTNYIMTRNGTIRSLASFEEEAGATSGLCFKAANGIVYFKSTDSSVCKRFDAQGNLVNSTFVPPTEVYYDDFMLNDLDQPYLIKAAGNTKYYMGENCRSLHKFTFASDDTFTYENIVLDNEEASETYGNMKMYVFANDRLYFLARNSLFWCNIDTGERHTVSNGYRYKTLTAGLDGKLYFTGVNSGLDDVYGIILPDDSVEVRTEKYAPQYDVVYVNPIN